MAEMQDIYIVSGVRTAIGDFGGALKDKAPDELGTLVIAEAIRRAGIAAADVQHVVMGQAIPSQPRDSYVARVCAVNAGVPIEAPALTVNRLCASGMQAIVSGAQLIALEECEIVVTGGTEVMSRSPYVLTASRWGQKMGDAKVTDMMVAALHDPFGNGHMGITAENVAAKWKVTRDEQDAFALESQRRAVKARDAGFFKDQILPIEIETRKGKIVFDKDEYIRDDASADGLRALKPVFKKDGSVTAGNASGINDGAGAVVLMSAKAAQARGLKPMARILGYGHAAVEPSEMGIGPVPAVQNVMKKIGMKVSDMDTIESNEAFAAQAIAVMRDLGLPADKTNPNGGAIAMGHPVGATGAIVTVKALYELKRTGKTYGLITMCIGGGQGIAMVIENLH